MISQRNTLKVNSNIINVLEFKEMKKEELKLYNQNCEYLNLA